MASDAHASVPAFPHRRADAHKGSVGRLIIVGGRFDGVGMVGAPALAAVAAFRTGAGLVQILTPLEAQLPVAVLAPCATTRAMHPQEASRLAGLAQQFGADVVAVGPGLSPVVDASDICALMRDFGGGIVVDADGLNALAQNGDWRAPSDRRVVFTPHPGEMQRLLHGAGMSTDASDRTACAKSFARQKNVVLVLKGPGTVVSDGQRVYVNATGNAGLATGGAGDVLTGVIAALMGQKMDAFSAAVLGVYLHGLAGDIAAERLGPISLTASDVADALCDAVRRHQQS